MSITLNKNDTCLYNGQIVNIIMINNTIVWRRIASYIQGTTPNCTVTVEPSKEIFQFITIEVRGNSYSSSYLGSGTAKLIENSVEAIGLTPNEIITFNGAKTTCTMMGGVKGDYSVNAIGYYPLVLRIVKANNDGTYTIQNNSNTYSISGTAVNNNEYKLLFAIPTVYTNENMLSVIKSSGNEATLGSYQTISSSYINGFSNPEIFGTTVRLYNLSLNFKNMSEGVTYEQVFIAEGEVGDALQETIFTLNLSKDTHQGGELGS